ncbi:hypothetical protein BpHYR1_009613 [Brachionus plicatilis]|uniref:Uncharacterized protein n=1 Tax=Brachionus plicatilis TaxID=10195 RepID=A0A3M7T5M5_BRAPC|nr:hypothetical protein BpHYR1_009613 [Brachionus plicatilis]
MSDGRGWLAGDKFTYAIRAISNWKKSEENPVKYLKREVEVDRFGVANENGGPMRSINQSSGN